MPTPRTAFTDNPFGYLAELLGQSPTSAAEYELANPPIVNPAAMSPWPTLSMDGRNTDPRVGMGNWNVMPVGSDVDFPTTPAPVETGGTPMPYPTPVPYPTPQPYPTAQPYPTPQSYPTAQPYPTPQSYPVRPGAPTDVTATAGGLGFAGPAGGTTPNARTVSYQEPTVGVLPGGQGIAPAPDRAAKAEYNRQVLNNPDIGTTPGNPGDLLYGIGLGLASMAGGARGDFSLPLSVMNQRMQSARYGQQLDLQKEELGLKRQQLEGEQRSRSLSDMKAAMELAVNIDPQSVSPELEQRIVASLGPNASIWEAVKEGGDSAKQLYRFVLGAKGDDQATIEKKMLDLSMLPRKAQKIAIQLEVDAFKAYQESNAKKKGEIAADPLSVVKDKDDAAMLQRMGLEPTQSNLALAHQADLEEKEGIKMREERRTQMLKTGDELVNALADMWLQYTKGHGGVYSDVTDAAEKQILLDLAQEYRVHQQAMQGAMAQQMKPLEGEAAGTIAMFRNNDRVLKALTTEFSAEERKKYSGFLTYSGRAMLQAVKHDPKFARFRALVEEGKGLAFSDAGKQLTGNERDIVFGYVPIGSEWSHVDFEEKIKEAGARNDFLMTERLVLYTTPRSELMEKLKIRDPYKDTRQPAGEESARAPGLPSIGDTASAYQRANPSEAAPKVGPGSPKAKEAEDLLRRRLGKR